MTFEELHAKVKGATADDLTNERIYNLIIEETAGNPTERALCESELYARAKELKEEGITVGSVKGIFKSAVNFEKQLNKQAEAERKAEEREKRLAALPSWATERGGIDDLKFCAEFAEVSDETRDSTRFRYVNGRFYSMNGYISDPEMISDIQWELSKLNGLVNVGKKAESLLKSLKGYCRSDPFPMNEEIIHFKNGMYQLFNDTFLPLFDFCANRFPVEYIRNPGEPEKFLRYLDDLLYPEDIPTLQEYLGYCLVPTKKAQKMLFIIGNGGEGKSVLASVLKAIFGSNMIIGKLKDVEKDGFMLSSLDGKLLLLDDDMTSKGFEESQTLKSIATSMETFSVNPKGLPRYDGIIMARIIAFGNADLKMLYDHSDGAYRRRLILHTKPKDPGRVDDTELADKLKAEIPAILHWMLEGLKRLRENRYHITESDRAKSNLEANKKEDFNVLEFLEDRDYIELGVKGAFASSADIVSSYNLWCDQNVKPKVKDGSLLRHLAKLATSSSFIPARHMINGLQTRGFEGILVKRYRAALPPIDTSNWKPS